MTEKPQVSVIINCYNSEKYLRETIDSLIAQTFTSWEAIFWDNCSTDKTSEIINSYGDPRFRYFLAEKNTPLGEARNLAMEKVRGEYMCFLDSDDVWEPFFLDKCLRGIKDSGAGLIYTRFVFFNEEKTWLAVSYQEDGIVPLSRLIESYNIGMSAAMFCTKIVKDSFLYFDNSFSLIEDFDFFVRIASVSQVCYLKEPLMRYRCHLNNLSYSDRWVTELAVMLEKIKEDSQLRYFKNSIRRRLEIYKYKQIYKSEGRAKALKYAISHLGSNYKFLKYIYLMLKDNH